MKNIDAIVKGGKLILTIDLKQKGQLTQNGRSLKIAETEREGRSMFEGLDLGQYGEYGMMLMLTKRADEAAAKAKPKAKPEPDEEEDAPEYSRGDEVRVKVGKRWADATVLKVADDGRIRVKFDDANLATGYYPTDKVKAV